MIIFKILTLIPAFLIIFFITYLILKYLDKKINNLAVVLLILVIVNIDIFFLGSHNSLEWVTTGDIPIYLRLKNSEYLINDFYVNSMIKSPKIIFGYIIYFFNYLIELNFLLFFLKLTVNFLIPVFSYLIAKSFIKQTNQIIKSFLISTIILFSTGYFDFILYFVQIGINSFTSMRDISPQTFAHVLGLASILLIRNNFNNYYSSFLLFVTCIIHPIVGLTYFSFMIIFCNDKSYSKNFILFIYSKILVHKDKLIFSIFIPCSIIVYFFNAENPISSERFIEIYVESRHPHHYLVSDIFNLWSFIFFLIPLIFIALSKILKDIKMFYESLTIFLFFWSLIILQYISTEVFYLKTIASLGPTRFFSISIFCYLILFIKLFNRKLKFNKNEK